MSSRDQHGSSSSSRKRDRSPEDRRHDSSRSQRDKDRHEKSRDHHHSTHSSSHSRSSAKRDSSPKRHRSSHYKDDRDRHGKDEEKESTRKDRRRDDDDDDDDREGRHNSRKSSRRDADKDRSKNKDDNRDKEKKKSSHSRSSRRRDSDLSDSASGSGSGSGSGSETDSESEEDEMVKKAKSMIKTISEDDYFAKSVEFRLWLRQAKKKYFEDLSSDDARRYFKKFVRAWNDFDLDESYYKGIRTSQMQSKDLTKYQWRFAKKIGKDDQNKVEAIRDSIDTMTNTRFAQEVSRLTGKSTASGSDPTAGSSAPKRTLGPSLPPSANIGPSRRPMTADEVAEEEERDHIDRMRRRAEQRAYRKSKEADLEELAPKPTGREAMIEKRRAQTEYNRRERSPDVELSESDLMGTGSDFKSMLAAEKRRKEAREEKRGYNRDSAASGLRDAKLQAHREKEDKHIEALRQLWAQTQASKGL
ncbi:hypothetical protein BGZ79_009902 [Entomortierella chlamydospora]|nr:hypothetical protein BGZ79_009902 [Entomortierella chlamydospora]